MTVRIASQDLDRVRIDVEADLTGGDLHGRQHGYPVLAVDAFPDREFDWENA